MGKRIKNLSDLAEAAYPKKEVPEYKPSALMRFFSKPGNRVAVYIAIPIVIFAGFKVYYAYKNR